MVTLVSAGPVVEVTSNRNTVYVCADPLPVVTLVSAGPVVELTVSPASAGDIALFFLADTLLPLDGSSDSGTAVGTPGSILLDSENDDGFFDFDSENIFLTISFNEGDQIVVVLEDGSQEFTLAGAGLVEVDGTGILDTFTGTVAAFALVGAPLPRRCGCRCCRKPSPAPPVAPWPPLGWPHRTQKLWHAVAACAASWRFGNLTSAAVGDARASAPAPWSASPHTTQISPSWPTRHMVAPLLCVTTKTRVCVSS